MRDVLSAGLEARLYGRPEARRYAPRRESVRTTRIAAATSRRSCRGAGSR